MSNPNENIELSWKLFDYKDGTYIEGGTVIVSGKHLAWDPKLLEEIDAAQTQLNKGIITGRIHTLVIMETEAQSAKSGYRRFLTQLYHTK